MRLLLHGGRQRPQHVATNYNYGTLPTSVTVNLPPGVAGDLLVVLVAVAVNASASATFTLGGYTSLLSRLTNPYGAANRAILFRLFGKIATGSEAGTITPTSTGGVSPLYAEAKRFRPGRPVNLNSIVPARVAYNANIAASVPVAASVTPQSPIGHLMCWWLATGIPSTSGPMTGTPPGGFATRVNALGGSTPSTLAVISADKDWPGPGAPGTQALSLPPAFGASGNNEWVGLSLLAV